MNCSQVDMEGCECPKDSRHVLRCLRCMITAKCVLKSIQESWQSPLKGITIKDWPLLFLTISFLLYK